jgi:dihydroneopterin aldolase
VTGATSGATTVFVRGLTVQAEIGVHAHERGRRQPLVMDVEVELDTRPAPDLPTSAEWGAIADTVDYQRIVRRARAIAAAGHIRLVETFAWRLAQACLEEPRVVRVRVRVEKPEALAPDAAAAGVEISLMRA